MNNLQFEQLLDKCCDFLTAEAIKKDLTHQLDLKTAFVKFLQN